MVSVPADCSRGTASDLLFLKFAEMRTIDIRLFAGRFARSLLENLLPEEAIDNRQVVFGNSQVAHGALVLEVLKVLEVRD